LSRLVALLCFGLPLVSVAEPVRAPSPAPRLVLDVGELPASARPSLTPFKRHAGVELLSPTEPEPPQRDALLASARRSFGTMSFHRAVAELVAQESLLVDGARPSPQRSARLADLELFLGACMLLDQDPRGAEERFALARALEPGITVDPIFPPEVGRALAATRPGPMLPVEIVVTPTDGRLWIDGAAGPPRTRLSAGLHYLVLERADLRPVGRVVRVAKNAGRIELSATAPASTDAALLALRDRSVAKEEAVGVSRLLGAPLWRLSGEGSLIVADRYAASDPLRPTQTVRVPATDAAALEKALCAVDPCEPVRATPSKPVWRRSWFWGVIGGAAAVVVGGVIAGAVIGTRPRDYDVVVR
jgi:hypothetical protein